MTIHQLSVFIENSSGTLVQVLKLLKEAGIQLIAFTIADTAEYGICRFICDDSARAFEVLKAAGVAVSISEVFAVELDDKPGSAADAVEIFANEGISIAYLYSILLHGKAVLVFRTDNAPAAERAIETHGLHCISLK